MNYNEYFKNDEQKVATIKKRAVLKDGTDEFFFPVTCAEAIYCRDGISIEEKIQQVSDLASIKEVMLADDDTYDKTTFLSYLSSIISDDNIINNAMVMFSAQASDLPTTQDIYDIVIAKMGEVLFVNAYNTSTDEEFHSVFRNNKLSFWYKSIVEMANAEDNDKYVKRDYVDDVISKSSTEISDSINKELNSSIEKTKLEILSELQSAFLSQNSSIATTYVTKGYLTTELRKTLQDAQKYVEDALQSFDLADNEISNKLKEVDERLSVKNFEELMLYPITTPVGLSVYCLNEKKVYVNNGIIQDDAGNDILEWIELKTHTSENLNKLKTVEKSSLVGAINEVFQSGNNFKNGIRDAVIAKDSLVYIPENPTLNDFTNAINSIYNTELESSSASADEILLGKTAYVNNQRLVGTIPTNKCSGTTITPGTANIIIPKGYNSDAVTVAGDSDLEPWNIVEGRKIFGVTGTATTSAKEARGYYNVDQNNVKTSSSWTITIPINIDFTPSNVYVYMSVMVFGSKTSGILSSAVGWVSTDYKLEALYDSARSNQSSYTQRVCSAVVTSYSKTYITITMRMYRQTSSGTYTTSIYGGAGDPTNTSSMIWHIIGK